VAVFRRRPPQRPHVAITLLLMKEPLCADAWYFGQLSRPMIRAPELSGNVLITGLLSNGELGVAAGLGL
jgi:hypothetical protein